MPNSKSTIEGAFAGFLDEEIWLCWKEINKAGRKVKLPIHATTGRAASSTDPATWTTYGLAQKQVRKSRMGLGVALAAVGDRHLVGIDLDSCRDSTDGRIASWASTVLETVDSYAEVSPSGTGFKIFAVMTDREWMAARGLFGVSAVGTSRLGRTWKDRGGRHPAGVEVYLGARYFTVTGAAIAADAIKEITHADIRRLMTFCEKRFGQARPIARSLTDIRTAASDSSESGRAFRACLAAVRAGVGMADVPRWARERDAAVNEEKFDVSDEYWSRPRREGVQLDRDFSRALSLHQMQSATSCQDIEKPRSG